MIYRVIGFYNKALNAYPLITQCSTAGILIAAGDVIAQKFVESEKEINWSRTAKFGVFGLCFLGPVIGNWFKLLERMYGSKGNWTPIKKLITDQSLFAPTLNLANIGVLGLLNGQSFDQMKQTVNKDYKDIMIANYKVWPAVQTINFYLVPLNYRLPLVAVVSLFWNIYYTWKLGAKH